MSVESGMRCPAAAGVGVAGCRDGIGGGPDPKVSDKPKCCCTDMGTGFAAGTLYSNRSQVATASARSAQVP